MSTADKGARLGNMIVDTIVFLVLMLLVDFSLNLMADFLSYNLYEVINSFYPVILYFLYFFIFEQLLGKTPGKYLTRTIVVDRKGGKPAARKIFIRSLLRIIAYDAFSFLFGAAGLHDSYSKTMVIRQ